MEGIPSIAPFKKRLGELDAQMADPDFFSDSRRAATVSREHSKLNDLIETYETLERIEQECAEARAMATDAAGDDDMREMAEAELADLDVRRDQLREAVLVKMLPPDPSDSRNTVFEIRAGAGGDEASLFAAELYRAYVRYAERKGWAAESLGMHESEAGGFKEVSFLIKGDEVYSHLKFESGVHRVQRVPVTETNGRIHTSTVTVAVLPEAEEVDLQIDPNDLEVSATRASGAGGQHVNTTDSAIQMVHKPTGVTVYCADERSQIKNRAKALTVMRSRLLQLREEEERKKYADNRRSQVGTGDRSERIRTYNFPQSRVTDHRIGLTQHNLTEVMDGDIETIVEALHKADHDAKVASMLEEVAAGG